MKANLIDLNSILFEQIERLNDDDVKGEDLDEQIKRTKAIYKVASVIVDNSSLMLQAAKFEAEGFKTNVDIPKMIGSN